MFERILAWLLTATTNPEQLAQLLSVLDKFLPIIERVLALAEKYPTIVNLLLDRFFPQTKRAPLAVRMKEIENALAPPDYLPGIPPRRALNIRKQKARRQKRP